jgi:serine/threonine protein kinase
MASSQISDLLKHFRLVAEVTAEYTTHTEYRADKARGIRLEKVEKRWYRRKRIGSGGFSKVWLEATQEDDNKKRAVKIIDKDYLEGWDWKKELLALAEFSKEQYQQAGVLIKFFGWFEDPLNLYLSMEYFELGDLRQHIKESITENDVKDITTDVLTGLSMMHNENFVHRDVKPGNIFVVQMPPTSRWWVKIGDFGISKRVQSNATAFRTVVGTPCYQAPEVDGELDTDEETSIYDNAVDMWSLGCVIYEIATQKLPFPRRSTVQQFCNGRLPFPEQPLSAKLSMDGVEFVKRLIVPSPRERLSAEDALASSWLSQETRDIGLKTEEPIGITNQALNKKQDENTSLLQTSGDETVRLRPVQIVTSSSPDGKLVASGSWENTVRLWDPATGAAHSTLEGHSNSVYCIAFSPDGKLVASGSHDNTVRLWDPATGAARSTLKGHSSYVYAIAFSPDGKLVASGSWDNTVRLWDPATGAARSTLKGHSSLVFRIAFSPDGKLVASGSNDNTVRLWDPATGAARSTLKGHSGYVNCIAFSPDGKLVASGSDDSTVRLWDSAVETRRNNF